MKIQEEQSVLSITRGHPGPVKITKDQQERTPGILRNYLP
jgi:hypothetical protein